VKASAASLFGVVGVFAILSLRPAAVSAADGAAGDSLSLRDAVRLAVGNHPSVEQALEGVSAAEAQVGVARSALYPGVSVEASYARLDPVSTMAVPGAGAEDLFPHDNYDVHVGAGKRLYDAGRARTGVRLAEAGAQVTRDNAETARWSLAYQTAATFNLILILRENILVLDEQIRTLEEHLDVSRKRDETGSATKLDVLTTQVRVASARDARIDAGASLARQEIVLRQLVGYPAERPVLLRGDFSAPLVAVNRDSLLAAAMRDRPELWSSQDAESTAVVATRLASLGEKPTLGVGINSGLKNGYFPGLNRMKANVAASLTLELPLFDGYRTLHQVEQSRANLRAAQARTAEVRRRIAAEVEQAIVAAQADQEKIRNSQVQVDRAREAVAMAETQYRAGVITNLDLLDVETSMSEAKLLYLRATYDYAASLIALDRATGRRIW
jgi:outer membrane protein